jgi:hypothetical protein
MTRAKDELDLVVPHRVYTHQQARFGDLWRLLANYVLMYTYFHYSTERFHAWETGESTV